MDPERWHEIRSIVEATFDLPLADRSAHLDRACRDPEIRHEVDELLRQDEVAPAVLDPPTHGSLWRRLAPIRIFDGADLGDYVIEEELGAGGMGVVHAARQKQPERRVALKMLRTGASSPDALRRFRHESEVLARLQHPGIARIYSAGLHQEDGREVPWFAMELVEDAKPVTEFVRDRRMGPEGRLDLFLKICDAVHLGHQKGVIHRDLKPGNVLVGADGEPKIIDFGIARTFDLDRTRLTQDGAAAGVIGTLQSMSPEQAAGDPDLDVRSDVYSLGVLLYELLTDSTPHDFHGKAVHEVARMVVEDPPRPPRSVAPRLPEDLEIVLLKALEKERHRRYGSAHELVADLARYRAHQPIEARRPSTVYQLTLFARRHRALVMASVIAIVALTSALLWSLDSTREARAAETLANTARHNADRLRMQETAAREHAEDLFVRSLDVNDAFVGEFLDRVRRLPGATQVSHDMLELTIQHLEYLVDSAGESGRAHEALARALGRLGELQGSRMRTSLGDDDLAARSYRRAFEMAQQLHHEDPHSAERVKLLAWCQGNLALWHLFRGEHDAARDLLEDQLGLLEHAVEDTPEKGLRGSLAQTLQHLSSVEGLQGNHEGALALMERARALYVDLLEDHPDDRMIRFHLATATGRCGIARFRSGDDSGIDELLEECDILEEVLEITPHDARARTLLAETHMILCELETERLDPDLAREHGHESLALIEELQESDPSSVKYRHLKANVTFRLAQVEETAAEDGDEELIREYRADAVRWYETSLALLEALEREGALPPHELDHPQRVREHIQRARQQL